MLFFICIGIMGAYAWFMLMAIAGWLRPVKKYPFRNSVVPSTLIVPFRNEQKMLGPLIHAIHSQNIKPRALFVDDDSTDDSTAMIMHAGMNCVLSRGEGKKKACATGIEEAHTPLLVFTDADCTFPKTYIEEINNAYTNTKFDFAYGPVIYNYQKPGFMRSIFFLDQLALNGFSLGTGNMNMHLYCSGANMAGSKKMLAQAASNLKTSNNLSGDDGTLLHYCRRHDGKIITLLHRNALVTTEGPATLGGFLKQRLRWGQKTGNGSGLMLVLCSAVVLLSCTVSVFGLTSWLSGFSNDSWYLLPAANLLIDLLFLFLVASRLGVANHLWFFIPAWIFNILYIPLVGLTGLVYAGTWKGRKIRS